MRPIRLLVLLLLLALSLGVAACGGSDSSSTTAASTAKPAADACAKPGLDLVKGGTLTIGTDKPAFPPYFVDDKPSNGKGFESALGYAIASKLGFAPAAVHWTVVPFNTSYAPGPKRFDFDLNQISKKPSRLKRADFSSTYYSTPQAVLALSKSSAAAATSVAELKDVKIGVQIGTTSLDAIDEVIKPSSQPQVFNDSNDVVRALKAGRVDAVVVDLPTAIYLRDAVVSGSKVVGQFEATQHEEWGAVLAKGSSLTACVSKAIDGLRSSGELKTITDRWMSGSANAPSLQ